MLFCLRQNSETLIYASYNIAPVRNVQPSLIKKNNSGDRCVPVLCSSPDKLVKDDSFTTLIMICPTYVPRLIPARSLVTNTHAEINPEGDRDWAEMENHGAKTEGPTGQQDASE